MFLLVPAYPGCPGSKAVKRSLLLLSQGSLAKHLRNDELLYHTFVIQSAGERTVKIGEYLAKLQAK